MAIEHRLLLLALAVTAVGAAPAAAQDHSGPSLLLIDPDTRVKSVDFRFTGGQTLEEPVLRASIGLQEPGTFGRIKRKLDWLPFVSGPPLMPFEPTAVQKDKIRLTRTYEDAGFPKAEIGYEVVLDTTDNTVKVTYVVEEGPPLLLRSIAVLSPAADSLPFPPDLEASWDRFAGQLAGRVGIRLSRSAETALRTDVMTWLRNHGYAFAKVSSTVARDSTDGASVRITARPGPRARVGAIDVEGTEHLSERTIRRELPFHSGDPFRAVELSEGQRQLFGLDLVRLALVDVAPDQPEDSTADVVVRVHEASRRVIDARAGYVSQSGLSADANWQNRNFLGGARTLRLDAEARTGVLATGSDRAIRYGAAISLHQPYLGDRRVSGLLSPFVEYRDDVFDRSTRTGVTATAIWERAALKTVSLSYEFSVRHVSTPRGGAFAGASNLFDLLRILDSAGVNSRSNALTARVTWGHLDNPVDPHSGLVVRTSAALAGPSPISTVEYGRLEASVEGFLPLSRRVALMARIGGGRLLPFGRSVPSSDPADRLPALIRLRDVVFTAGGTNDVRGWGADLLGPKVPDFDVKVQGDTLILRSADRYVPLGGLARWSGSLELRLPMPFAGPSNGVFTFLDGGQVTIPDDRFVPVGGLGPLDDFYAATGLGLQFGTLVGPIRIALAYKLNPSPLDIRDPDLVAAAQLQGRPLSTVPVENLRRWHLHLSIGRGF